MLKTLAWPRRAIASFVVVAALTAVVASPALAITNGNLDGNGHPYVGLMVAKDADGNPLWRCSGTLMAAQVFLTAGHCTEAPAASAEIWFAADMTNAALHGYPFTGEVSGTVYPHPDYDPNAFYYRDMGIVLLNTPVAGPYGAAPALNSEDAWKTKRGQQKVTFDAVGYGLQESFPAQSANPSVGLRIRMIAHPKLDQINVPGYVGDFSLVLSNNAKTGGTCFGDSGGPNFLAGTNVVAAVTSFGKNGNCAGQGGVFRMDRSWSLAFLADAMDGVIGDDYDGGDN